MEAKRGARRRLPLLFDLGDRRLETMDRNGIGYVVLSQSDPGVQMQDLCKKTAQHLCPLIGVFVAMGMSIRETEGADPLLVRVDGGLIRGRMKNGVDHFMGLPYAAAPIGKLRWRDPQPVVSWQGIREASEPGPRCIQPARSQSSATVEAPMSEDCLYLNLWRPRIAPPNKLPVMVWLHGGAFVSGAGSLPLYDGSALARRGVLVVTLNYRLGALGTFSLPALRASAADESGNFGLRDQEAALRWVQRNIARFGGDPGRVTLFGESAGGASVLYHMGRPSMAGLFQRAIVQSGGLALPELSAAQADATGSTMAKRVLPQDLPARDWLEALRALPASRTLDMPRSQADTMPYIDGMTLASPMAEAFEAGGQLHMPLLIGRNDYEAGFFPAAFSEQLPQQLGDRWVSIREMTYGYACQSPKLAAQQVAGLRFAGVNTRNIALAASASDPVYFYRYAHVDQSQLGSVAGAIHTAELPYVFGTLPGNAGLQDRHISALLMDAWVSFAKGDAPIAGGGGAWPRYLEDSRQLALVGQSQIMTGEDPDTQLLDHL
jgi:para-nitrobenzyl esterase